MEKIICLISIVFIMLWAVSCENGQIDNIRTTEEKTIKDGTVFKINLDDQSADRVGTKQIYLKYNDGYYLERICETRIGVKVGKITTPSKYNQGDIYYSFRGYNTDKNGNGKTIITYEGLLDIDVGYADFISDTTLYAQWEEYKNSGWGVIISGDFGRDE